jgi:hypothetical protein
MGLNWYANLPKPLGRKSVGTARQPTIMPRLGGPEAFAQMTALRPDLPAIFTTGHSNLRLVETLAQFRTRLRARGNVLEVAERQRVVRLLVHEILVSSYNITIRHSFHCRPLRPIRTMEFGQATNRPSPILAQIIFCVHTVNTPGTMFPVRGSRGALTWGKPI